MAFTNFDTKEINCKVVYFGPRGSGKLSNLRSLYEGTSPEVKSGLMELNSKDSSNRFLNFLPISLGHVKDFHLKMHLFILPDENIYETVPDVILKGVDGFIFVADSQVERMSDNIECIQKTKRLLSEKGYNPSEMASVIQYNKRDLKSIIPIDIMKKELNTGNSLDQEAIASESVGTMETLQAMAKQVIYKLSP